MTEPLSAQQAKLLIKTILEDGEVSFSDKCFSDHAMERSEERGMDTSDIRNILKAGVVDDAPDLINGTWRYRVRTSRMCAVVAFRSERELRVVTAWRIKR